MDAQVNAGQAEAESAPHWVEVVDGQGRFPTRLLGPYAGAPQAGRACRAVLRLLNPARYTAWVRSQGELQTRGDAASAAGPAQPNPA